ncbi:hypothetical protein BWD162_014270 [Bartonella sp. WD16.2]|nr:hypothetical protein BWD162_014270 [Bartonella sp. WD16.2]
MSQIETVDWVHLLDFTVMKGSPLAYLKDMQKHETYVFDGVLSFELSASSNDRHHW